MQRLSLYAAVTCGGDGAGAIWPERRKISRTDIACCCASSIIHRCFTTEALYRYETFQSPHKPKAGLCGAPPDQWGTRRACLGEPVIIVRARAAAWGLSSTSRG